MHPVRKYRKENGLRIRQLAETLNVSRSMLSRIERYERGLNNNLMRRVHEVTGIPLEQLIGDETDGD